MPSPFPGMDPFIEGQDWQTFHTRAINAIGDQLVPLVRHRYVVGVENTVYLATEIGEDGGSYSPDVTVYEGGKNFSQSDGNIAVLEQPAILTTPMHEPIEEHYLVLRKRNDSRAVTAIELLSPTNKSLSDGRAEYLTKRASLLKSQTHLVEIDLLRGGRRLPTNEPLPVADYYGFVSRAGRRPEVEVFSWALEQRMPHIPIPLADDDPDVAIDLQSMLESIYDRCGIGDLLDYKLPVTPRLNREQAQWVQTQLQTKSLS